MVWYKVTMFQESFKYYKSRNPHPDLSRLPEKFMENVRYQILITLVYILYDNSKLL